MADVRTLDQDRAEYAYAWAQEYTNEYVNLVKGAPALIMANGLMQALAYYEGKSKEGKRLVRQISKWLFKQKLSGGEDFSELMQSLYKGDAVKYMQATSETLEVLRWIKQFGAAVLASGGKNVR